MLVTGFGLPIALSILVYLPLTSKIVALLRPAVIWPSMLGRRGARFWPRVAGRIPNLGQISYVFLFLLLNILFTAVKYESRQPNAWNPTVHSEIMSYVLGRTGIYAYQILPLVVLFAGRNNVLLWLTNWQHSTYILLHRWLAFIFTLQSILHSIVALAKYLQTGMYYMEVSKPYWIWGIVATICVVLLCFTSSLPLRLPSYQAFLVYHIVLSVVTVVGCWYHAYDLYGLLGGVGYWIYAVAAVWAFDRGARLLRILLCGIRRANVKDLGGTGYARVDIPGVRWGSRPGLHAYLYFPTRTPWTPWENHPFSVMPTILLDSASHQHDAALTRKTSSRISSDVEDVHTDIEKCPTTASSDPAAESLVQDSTGITFFVRKGSRMANILPSQQNLLTLVEGPYRNSSSEEILRCDRLLLLAGGIGITALVPHMAAHFNIRLCWSLKEAARCLIDETKRVIDRVNERDIRVGARFDLTQLVSQEVAQGWKKLGIVVAGPTALCDDARSAVIAASQQLTATEIAFDIESYSW